jgi:hypothetical protein
MAILASFLAVTLLMVGWASLSPVASRYTVTSGLGASPVTFPVANGRTSADCSRTSTGLPALIDLGPESYGGYSGGLYPGGLNEPSPEYRQEGLAAAQRIQPLDRFGQPYPGGKVVLLSIGMSNATQEFSAFKRWADADAQKHPSLAIVDGAQGGWDAVDISKPTAEYWAEVDRRLRSAGVSRSQVQVAWLKEAIANESAAFPTDAQKLRFRLREIVRIMAERYPSLQIVYLASRTYGGYSTRPLNPEPFAYESGFAVKWLIEERITGEASGPWLAWGPYLWTDGTRGRSDGLTWTCADTVADGVHPSASGQRKVAELLLSFFRTEPTANSWFLREPAVAGHP